MDIRRRLLNHYKRWNIPFDEERQFTQLKNRIITIISRHIGQLLVSKPKIEESLLPSWVRISIFLTSSLTTNES